MRAIIIVIMIGLNAVLCSHAARVWFAGIMNEEREAWHDRFNRNVGFGQ